MARSRRTRERIFSVVDVASAVVIWIGWRVCGFLGEEAEKCDDEGNCEGVDVEVDWNSVTGVLRTLRKAM